MAQMGDVVPVDDLDRRYPFCDEHVHGSQGEPFGHAPVRIAEAIAAERARGKRVRVVLPPIRGLSEAVESAYMHLTTFDPEGFRTGIL